jgi:hypothetical protein
MAMSNLGEGIHISAGCGKEACNHKEPGGMMRLLGRRAAVFYIRRKSRIYGNTFVHKAP